MVEKLTVSYIISCSHEFVWSNFVLTGHESVNTLLIFKKKFHANERFLSLLCEHVKLFGSGQQIRYTALRQSKNCLTEQTLTN